MTEWPGPTAAACERGARRGREPGERLSQTHGGVGDGGESISVVSDGVDDGLAVSTAQVATPPATLAGRARELIMGAYKLDDELLMVLDVRQALNVKNNKSEGVSA